MREYIMRYENNVLQLLPDKIQPLVRCKDCDFGKCCQNGKHELSVECHNPEKLVVEVHTPEWFCADGWKEGDGE